MELNEEKFKIKIHTIYSFTGFYHFFKAASTPEAIASID